MLALCQIFFSFLHKRNESLKNVSRDFSQELKGMSTQENQCDAPEHMTTSTDTEKNHLIKSNARA